MTITTVGLLVMIVKIFRLIGHTKYSCYVYALYLCTCVYAW